jgi:hypothetical protein
MKQLTIFISLIFILRSQNTFASNVEAYGKKYYNTCFSATAIKGQVFLNYQNPALTYPGVRVFLHYGLNGHLPSTGAPIEWQNINDAEMTPVQNQVWAIQLDLTLHERSYNYFYDSFSFVFLIVQADGTVMYDNSGNGSQSYYKANLPEMRLRCSNSPTIADIPLIPIEVMTNSK